MEQHHIFTGNTRRLHLLYEKMKRKEPVSLVFLGASVTLGIRIEEKHQFPVIITKYFQDKYQNNQIVCHNHSEAGTPSLNGLYQSYFLLEKYAPDLIVIDYSINDQKNPPHRDAYESLIVKCSQLSTHPAIITFFVKSLMGYTCAPQMSAICRHYQIPYVNVGARLDEDLSKGVLQWEDYSYDNCHPAPTGHHYIAKCLIELFEKTCQLPPMTEFIPQKELFHNALAELSFLIPPGGKHISLSPVTMEFSAECSMLFICYIAGITMDYGNLDVIVDGKNLVCLSSLRIHEWERPVQDILYLSKTAETHHIALRPQAGSEQKLFPLLCLGIC